jgi:Glucodextranase, domain B
MLPWLMQVRTLAVSSRVGLIAALAALRLGCGCGSGPGNGPGDGPDSGSPDGPDARSEPSYCVPDLLPPDPGDVPAGVSIVFPPPSSLTEAGAITVRGTVRLDAGVAAIRVNGVAAQSADGFHHWQVSVPLQPGSNTLAVESEDADGQLDPAAAQVTVAMSPNPMVKPTAVIVDAPRNRALVIDAGSNALLAVDLATGSRAIVYEPPDMDTAGVSAVRPHVPPLPPAFPLVDVALLGSEGQRALVVAERTLFSVELASGKDTVISDSEVGSGPAFMRLVDVALDEERGRALVLDRGLDALLAVDLTTGARTVISDEVTGSGPMLDLVSGLVLDAEAGRALVIPGSIEEDALLAVDLATGARTLISGQDRGTGPALAVTQDLALDATGNRVLITDLIRGLVAVDLATGDRAILSGAATAGGPGLEEPDGVALDAQQGRALLVDAARDLLVAVDLETGGRTLLSGDTVGTGPELHKPQALALDGEARRVIIGDLIGYALVAVDLTSGARSMISSYAVGQGPSLGNVQSVALDRADDGSGDRILVTNSYDDVLLAVDPATGARTVISGNGVGSGPALTDPSHLVVDEPGNQAVVVMSAGIMAVSLDTGDRTLLASRGGNESIAWLYMDPPCNHVLMASGSPFDHGLFALDLDTHVAVRVSDYNACTEVPAGVLETPTYDPRTGRVLGWHDLITALMAVDTSTGACTTQVAPAIEGGGPWPYPHRAMLVDPATGLLLLADNVSKSLMALDPETGERVIVSR